MKNRKTTICIIVVLILVVLVGVPVYTYNRNSNHKLTDNEKKIKSVSEEYLTIDGKQTAQVEDYTVTLESYSYDSDIYSGRMLLSIMQEGKEGKDISCCGERPYAYYLWFGGKQPETGYYFHFKQDNEPDNEPGTSMRVLNKKMLLYYKGTKKYIYYEFKIDGLNEDGFTGILDIKDWRIEKPLGINKGEGVVGTFKLEDNIKWDEYTSESTKDVIKVSNYAAQINDGEKIKINDFKIVMKNGKKYMLDDEEITEVPYELPFEITRLRYSKGIDLEQIDYIVLNGIKYSK